MPASIAPVLLLLAAAAPGNDALPSGDSTAWRQAMLDWSAPPAAPVDTLTLPQGNRPAPTLRIEKPVAFGWLSSGFGVRADPMTGGWRAHRGIDIAAPVGTPIVASSDGRVSFAGVAGGYGLMVQIDHPGGLQTRYGHLSRIVAHAGQPVRRGDVIGAMGSTGRSTGSHLHFEIRVVGLAVDPTRPLPATLPWSGSPDDSAPAPFAPASAPEGPVAIRWQGWTNPADRLPAAF